jgi:hypothetical protein
MSLSDILDGAFKLLKANWRAALLIAGAFAIPVDIALAFARRNVYGNRGLIEVLNNPSSQPRGSVGAQYQALLVTIVVGSFVTFFVGATLSKVIAASYLGGEWPRSSRDGSWSTYWRRSRSRSVRSQGLS